MGSQMNQVTCRNQSLTELFSEPLTIPTYQRAYCWRKGTVTDLLETLRLRNCKVPNHDSVTHLGTIICKRKEGRLEIVDGQQRLLTLTLLDYCILKEASQAPLLKADVKETSNDSLSAQKHLLLAQETIKDWVKKSDLPNWPALKGRIQFCVVTLPEGEPDDLAYTFFNSENSSGKKLSDYDLLKAHHLRFISNNSIAEHVAERWDSNGPLGYENILHQTLYRLRIWSRFGRPLVDAEREHKLYEHFSTRLSNQGGTVFPSLPMEFNSAIHGGERFFHFAERFRLLLEEFGKTKACASLSEHLSGHSSNVLRDSIRTLLFLYFCKFGNFYLDDALFCIADFISKLRNESQVRTTAIHQDALKECLYSIDTALDPGQFFDWYLEPARHYVPNDTNGNNVKGRYWRSLSMLFRAIEERLVPMKHVCRERRGILDTKPSSEGSKGGEPQ